MHSCSVRKRLCPNGNVCSFSKPNAKKAFGCIFLIITINVTKSAVSRGGSSHGEFCCAPELCRQAVTCIVCELRGTKLFSTALLTEWSRAGNLQVNGTRQGDHGFNENVVVPIRFRKKSVWSGHLKLITLLQNIISYNWILYGITLEF